MRARFAHGSLQVGCVQGDDHHKVEIVHCHGIETTLRAMKNHEMNAEVQRWCCGLLAVLARNDDYKLAIAEAGGIQAILDSMYSFAAVSLVQVNHAELKKPIHAMH